MGAIAVHHTATDTGAWDGPANEARLKSGETEAYYKRAFAWQDPEGDPTVKAAYRFIHHMVSGDGTPGAASTRACSSAIGVLNGGRGGTTIPDADRRGVYNHLAAHLRDADMEPPDLREIGDGEIETRSMEVPALEVREVNGAPVIAGYAAVFNVKSQPLMGGLFREYVSPGAFTNTLLDGDARALWGHDPTMVLGRVRNGTLKLSEDAVGLRYEVTPPDTQWARDALVTMKRGDVTQSSFGFRTIKDDWTKDADGMALRQLIEVKLFEVSPVAFPAYEQTSASARSMVNKLLAQQSDQVALELAAERKRALEHLHTIRRKLALAELD